MSVLCTYNVIAQALPSTCTGFEQMIMTTFLLFLGLVGLVVAFQGPDGGGPRVQ